VDIAPFLAEGRNAVCVVANAWGVKTYKALSSIGGFFAWGAIAHDGGVETFDTPGEWKAMRYTGWDEDTPKFSFPLNPLEVYRQGVFPESWIRPDFNDSG
jgi:hypothetical protein